MDYGNGAGLALALAGVVGAVVAVSWTVVVGWSLLRSFMVGRDDDEAG